MCCTSAHSIGDRWKRRREKGGGANPVGPGTSVSGGVRTRSVYLNCHGRARPNT